MAESSSLQNLRIHGDNILECERALRLVKAALGASDENMSFIGGSAYSPIYRIKSNINTLFNFRLFPGYGRWGFDIKQYLMDRGAILREATDAIITRLNNEGKTFHEEPILAIEFCGALPAGNNAWQRCGRALASAYAQIPYIYYAEIGGVELDTNRKIKAPRFPNPIVPFAYITLGDVEKIIALPVFIESPSLDDVNKNRFEKYFGLDESIILIRKVLLGEDTNDINKILKEKAIKIVQTLAETRKKNDTLSLEEWDLLKNMQSGKEKAEWFIKKGMTWKKKIGIKKLTKTFPILLKLTIAEGAVGAASKDMPFCLLPPNKRNKYSKKIQKLYKHRVSNHFLDWVANSSKPLLCVWVAGFKPRGDDSRPDRGLVPLARMIFGRDEVDLLVIVYGPAKPITWQKLQHDIWALPKINGLWEAIIGLSDGVLIDSPTGGELKNIGYILPKREKKQAIELLKPAKITPSFGEQDVDSVIHLLFSNDIEDRVYEGMCNPPGGDWSGISIIDYKNLKEYRWTSLPRVSGHNTKRPDHLIQFQKGNIFLSIESKDKASALEENIGPRLIKYIYILLENPPISFRLKGEGLWRPLDHLFNLKGNVISGAAFRFTDDKELKKTLDRGKLDIIFAIDFSPISHKVKISVMMVEKIKDMLETIEKLGARFNEIWDIQFVVI